MSNEEVDRRISFIIEQQTQFASDIQQLREVQVQTEQVVARLANVTLEGFKDVNAKINALVDSQIRTDERLQKTDEQLRKTDEHLRKTDENVRKTDESLRNLIANVDRYFSEGRNGR